MTGVLPPSGVGACISGSTPAGGHNTPLDRANLSPSGSLLWPVVVPPGAILPPCGASCIGAQSLAAGGAVWAGGVAGAGGACALAMPDAAINMHENRAEYLLCMRGKRPMRAEVPRKSPRFRICGSGSAKNAPSAALGAVRSG
jgi:hypothetical protein